MQCKARQAIPLKLQSSKHPSIQIGDGGMRGAFESAALRQEWRSVLNKLLNSAIIPILSFSYGPRAFRRPTPLTGSRASFLTLFVSTIFGWRFFTCFYNLWTPLGRPKFTKNILKWVLKRLLFSSLFFINVSLIFSLFGRVRPSFFKLSPRRGLDF